MSNQYIDPRFKHVIVDSFWALTFPRIPPLGIGLRFSKHASRGAGTGGILVTVTTISKRTFSLRAPFGLGPFSQSGSVSPTCELVPTDHRMRCLFYTYRVRDPLLGRCAFCHAAPCPYSVSPRARANLDNFIIIIYYFFSLSPRSDRV